MKLRKKLPWAAAMTTAMTVVALGIATVSADAAPTGQRPPAAKQLPHPPTPQPVKPQTIKPHALGNYQIVNSGQVTVAANSQSEAGATCPAGTMPLSGGESNTSSGAVHLARSYPYQNTWYADVSTPLPPAAPSAPTSSAAAASPATKSSKARRSTSTPPQWERQCSVQRA